MPLRSGKNSFSDNVQELISSKPSAARSKGIHTLAKREGISYDKAKQKQAVAIAYSKKRGK